MPIRVEVVPPNSAWPDAFQSEDEGYRLSHPRSHYKLRLGRNVGASPRIFPFPKRSNTSGEP
jgi:hypothetical protein